MDSLKQELLDKMQGALTPFQNFQGNMSKTGDVRVSHHGLVTNIKIFTSNGAREFTVTLKEILS